jgi:hypothetical protein
MSNLENFYVSKIFQVSVEGLQVSIPGCVPAVENQWLKQQDGEGNNVKWKFDQFPENNFSRFFLVWYIFNRASKRQGLNPVLRNNPFSKIQYLLEK